MLEVEIGGVAEAFANLTERGAVDLVVKATLTLSDSGFVAVKDAVAYGEIKDESLTGKIPFSQLIIFLYETSDADLSGKLKGLFGGGASSSDEATADSADNTPPRDSESSSASAVSSSSSASASSAAAAEKETKKAATPVENTIPLSLEVTFPTIPPMTVEQKKTSRSRFVLLNFHMLTRIYYVIYLFRPRLRAIDAEELTKTRREEARNTFESYLYRLRDLLDDDNKDTPFKKCSQPRERNAIAEKLDESFAWLSDRGDLAETSQFLDKRIALECVFSFSLFV